MFTSMDIIITTMITKSMNIIMTTIMRNMSTIITTMTMKSVAADMTMTTITRNMSTIITTMTMKSVAADMIMTTIIITITTMMNAAADMTIITIIMQTKFSQAGAVRQLRNTQEKILKRSLRHCLRQKNMESSFVRKGMLPAEDGTWIYFDMVPEETEIRSGAPEYTGRLCVIGSKLNEDKLAELFGL